jgi:hypothetical protein
MVVVNELEGMWKEAKVFQFMALTWNLLEKIK